MENNDNIHMNLIDNSNINDKYVDMPTQYLS